MRSPVFGEAKNVAVRRRSRSEDGAGSEAILVIDDNARLCDLAKRALRADGWIVHVASSCSAALAAAANEPFALALSDYAMPGGDGLLLLAELERLQPDCRLVLWSAALPKTAARRARELDVTVLPGKLLGEKLCSAARAALAPRRPTPSCSTARQLGFLA